MFTKAESAKGIPQRLSSNNDPLFQYHHWQANLRILDMEEIKSVPYSPTSHSFIERLIGTIRREYLDRLLFCNPNDLKSKLKKFSHDYNQHRMHQSLNGLTPDSVGRDFPIRDSSLDHYS